ncbi:hypothetical protein NX794_07515 [Streptomyces sp. LP11]|uniref:Uncharacterized protein n=1 Tax=Streptomyces pyxinicus TaxID=2970331 RepID=A0ABT2AXV3_9ACTN|nr:hypothetical protein [Streptomyces sp. LP11]MCS0601078.1 hypothetical protein [Streptomyces sp. LP11]
MIGFMGLGVDADEAFDAAEAFFAYIEDPDSDLALVLSVEEAYGVVL